MALVPLAVIAVGVASVAVAGAATTTTKPKALTATVVSSSSIALHWTDASTNEIGFEIQRTLAKKTQFKPIATVAPNTSSFGDAGLTAATAYKYRVRAMKPVKGYSAFSNTVTATTSTAPPPADLTAPSVPTGFFADPTSCSSVRVGWNASTDNAGGSGLKGYNLYRNNAFIGLQTATSMSDAGLAASTDYAYAVSAVDNAGNESATSAPSTAHTSACQNRDGFLVKLTANGEHVWSASYGGNSTDVSDSVTGVSAVPGGDVVVVGLFKGAAVDFGGHALSSDQAGSGGFAVRLNGATGAYVWGSILYAGSMASGVSVDPSGNAYVVGVYSGRFVFAGQTFATPFMTGAFLVKYSSGGSEVWGKVFASTHGTIAYAVATDSNGNPAIAGSFTDTLNFGGSDLTASPGATDVFVARFTSSGAHVFSKGFGGYSTDYGWGIASDAAGNVVVTGAFFGTMNAGGANLTASPNFQDAYVVKYGPTGAHLTSVGYGGTNNEQGHGVAAGPNGFVVVGHWFSDTVDFGAGTWTRNGVDDAFLLSLGS